jgi:hypothetical protein
VTAGGLRPSVDANSRLKETAHVADDQIPSEVRPRASWLGAGICSVNRAERLDGATASSIPTALLERIVILLRDQQLTPSQRLALAERFGGIGEYPWGKALPACPLVAPMLRGRTTGSTSAIRPSDSACLEQGWPLRRQWSRPARLADAEVPHLE